jgi:hypothetical protein
MSRLIKGLSDAAIPFLYTNSPGPLHYTFANFLCRSTYE